MIRPRFALLLIAVTFPCGSLVPREQSAPKKGARLDALERLESEIRAARDAKKRQDAVLRYRAALREAGDLEKMLPLTEAESELCRVLAAEKSARAGVMRHAVMGRKGTRGA